MCVWRGPRGGAEVELCRGRQRKCVGLDLGADGGMVGSGRWGFGKIRVVGEALVKESDENKIKGLFSSI